MSAITSLEQRAFVKVQVARGVKPVDIYGQLVEACGNNALQKRTVQRWVAAFKKGRTSAEKMGGPGRPRTCANAKHVTAVRNLLKHDRRWTCTEVANQVGISNKAAHTILTKKLRLRKIAAKWIPHSLTEVQKWHRYATARLHLRRWR